MRPIQPRMMHLSGVRRRALGQSPIIFPVVVDLNVPVIDLSRVFTRLPGLLTEKGQIQYIKTHANNQYGDGLGAMTLVLSQTAYATVKREIASYVTSALEDPINFAGYRRDVVVKRDPVHAQVEKARRAVSSAELTQPGIRRSSSYCELGVKSDRLIGLFRVLPDMLRHFHDTDIREILSLLSRSLVQLAPDPKWTVRHAPMLSYFRSAIVCASNVAAVCHKKGIAGSPVMDLAKMMIMSFLTCSGNIIEVAHGNQELQSRFCGYTGSMIKFIADIMNLVSQRSGGFEILAQQFWVAIVLQYSGDLSFLVRHYQEVLRRIVTELHVLVSPLEEGGFTTLSSTVDDVVALLRVDINPNEIAAAFCSIAKTVPQQSVKSLPKGDMVLLLSIAILEKERALVGRFAPVLRYFEIEYYPVFSECLNGLIRPLFGAYQTRLSQVHEFADLKEDIVLVMTKILENFTGRNERLIPFVDDFARPLLNSCPWCLFNRSTIEAYLQAYADLKMNNTQRLMAFSELGRDMFRMCMLMAPFAFRSIIEHTLLSNEHLFTTDPVKMSIIMELLPPARISEFVHGLTIKSAAWGAFRALNSLEVIATRKRNDKLLLLALSYEKTNHAAHIRSLLVSAPQELLMIVWSHVAMFTKDDGDAFVHEMSVKFLKLAAEKKGIFSTANEASKVNIQTAILQFLCEQAAVCRHTNEIVAVLMCMADHTVVRSPHHIRAILVAITLLGKVLPLPNLDLGFRLRGSRLLMSLILKLISMRQLANAFNTWERVDTDCLLDFIKSTPCILGSLPTARDIASSSEIEYGDDTAELKLFVVKHAIDEQMYSKLSKLTQNILCNILVLFATYTQPSEKRTELADLNRSYALKMHGFGLSEILFFFWKIYPMSLPATAITIHTDEEVLGLITNALSEGTQSCALESDMAPYIARANPSSIGICELVSPEWAMALVTPEVMADERAVQYLVRCFDAFTPKSALLYVPQFVQAVKMDPTGVLKQFLLQFTSRNEAFRHFFLWQLEQEKKIRNGDEATVSVITEFTNRLRSTMNMHNMARFTNETEFIAKVSQISAKLLALPFDGRKKALVEELGRLKLSKGLYVPSNPEYEIISINADASIPLKSHSRVPILVSFNVRRDREKPRNIGCIFKIEDDIRTDALIIQVTARLQAIFTEAGIDTFLRPYLVMATGESRGVIEVIENSMSRHDLGVANKASLQDLFRMRYGQVGSDEYRAAQMNFIKSMAAYSLICYLFQVKDRHNANIMIDQAGHVMHIDFGFIFDTSPGGNMKFEKAPFKLTDEMVRVMGGDVNAYPFRHFSDLLCRCFIAARERYGELHAIGYLLRDTGMSCFKPDSFKRLRERFLVDRPDSEVQAYVDGLIYNSMNSMTTSAYDAFQSAQNGIFRL